MSGVDLPPLSPDSIVASRERYLKQQEQLREQRLLTVYKTAVTTNPVAASEARDIAKRLKLPETALEDNVEIAREMLRVREMQELQREFPSLEKRFANVEFMGLVHDDLGNIKSIETTLDWIKRHFQRGQLVNERGAIGTRDMVGLRTPDDARRILDIERRLGQPADEGIFGSALELAGQMVGPLATSAAAGAAAAGGAALFSWPGATLTAPAAFSSTFLTATFAQTAQIEAGNAFLDMVQKGYDRDVAMLGASFVGLANGVLETTGVGIALNPVRKAIMRRAAARLGAELVRPTTGAALKTLAGDYLKGIFGEATTESLQEVVNAIAEEGARRLANPELPAATLEETVGRVAHAFSKTAKGMTLLGLPAPAVRYISDTHAISDAKEQMRFLRSLRKGSEESKVRQRAPDVFAEHLREQAKGSPVENVFINGETFAETLQQMQAARDNSDEGPVGVSTVAQELDQLLPGTSEKIKEAVREGRDVDVVLPLADVEAKLAGTEIGERLLQHSRVVQDAPSFYEAKQIEKELEAEQARAQSILDEATAERQEFVQSAQRVEDNLREQIKVAQPKATPDEVRSEAVFYRNLIVNLAAELKTTPEEVYRQFPYRVRAGEAEAVAATEFDQLGNRRTDTPEFKAWFGNSKALEHVSGFSSRDAVFRPKVFYHGTNADFTQFEAGRESADSWGIFGNIEVRRHAIFFAADPSQAAAYSAKGEEGPSSQPTGARTVPVYLRVENPLDLTEDLDEADVEALAKASGHTERFIRSGSWALLDGDAGKLFVEEAKRLGYDGVILNEANLTTGEDAETWAVFEPTQIKSVNNRGTFDPNRASILEQHGTEDTSGQPDAGSRERLRGVGGEAGGRPSYGTPRDGAASVVGVHYSREARTELSGEFYGRGMAGAERSRVVGDPVLSRRIHFYVDTGGGVAPEIAVGSVRHEVQLDNVYDVDADPAGLVAQWRASREPFNELELAIVNAGFDGIYVPRAQGTQGVAVLLGPSHTAVPVQVQDGPQEARGQQTEAGAVRDPRGVRGSVGPLEQLRGEDLVDDAPLRGLPPTVRVGTEEVAFGPHKPAREAAAVYAERSGISYQPPRDYVPVDRARATRIAKAYEEMRHEPDNPEVRAAYEALVRETIAQWEVIKEVVGLKVDFIEDVDPYATNPRGAILDVVENNHLWVFPTDAGYGDATSAADAAAVTQNPMLAYVPGEEISGKPVRVNDVFRIVHDFFGHAKEGVGFRARGEENAWQQHMAMYSPLARKALTVETRGQNSWVNFGPAAEFNKTASGADTQYAPQKIGLLPDWVVEDGYAGGAPSLAAGKRRQPRGTFTPKTLTTLLTTRANTSTFLHETAHYYLTVLADLASRPEATPRLRADMQALLGWFGVADLATWNSLSLEQQRKHHESFAYNFEIYMFEGRAPTRELKTLFEKFATWLRTLYTSIRDELNAVFRAEFGEDLPILTGEVRLVMDRMLASEEAVTSEIERRSLLPYFQTQEEAAMSDEEWAAYQQLDRERKDEAIAQATRDDLRNLSWLDGAEGRLLKAAQKEHDEIRARVRREVVAEVQQNPRDQARRWLRRGEVVLEDGTIGKEENGVPHKLDREAVEALLPEGTDLTPLNGMLREDGLSPEHVAEMFGFSSGRALVDALMEMRPFDEVVNARVDQRMLAEHAEFVDGTPEHRERIHLAIHNAAHARFVAAEGRHLERSTKPVRLMVAAAKEAARRVLAKTPVSEVDPRKFLAVEARAARELRKAQKEGDREKVLHLKRRELLHTQLVHQAYAARDEIAKARRGFPKMFRPDPKTAKQRNLDYVIAARWVLARFGLTTELQQKAADTALQRVRQLTPEALGDLEPILADVAARAKPFGQLTLQEFRDLSGLVQWLWSRSKRENEIEADGRRMLRKEAVEEMLAAMREVHGDAPIKGVTSEKDRKALTFANTWAKLKRVESWARQMDGGEPNGPVTRYLWRPLRERYDAYMEERERLLTKVRDGLSKLELSDAKIDAPELLGAPTFNGTKELLGALQHSGNSSNLRRLLLGYGWTEALPKGEFNRQRWNALFDRLQKEGVITKAHMDYLQSVWDLNEFELKPLAQKVNRDVYGLFFEEIQAEPIETIWGTYRGGYMPAKLDPDHPGNADVKQRAGLDAVQQMELEARSMLSSGRAFTLSRVDGVKRPLLLDVRLQAQHLDEVLRFIYMQPALRDVASILKDSEFAGYLNAVDPSAIKSMLLPWLEDVAQNRVTKPSSIPALDKFFGFLRRSVGLNFMFGSVRNAAQQFTGMSNVLIYVKPRYIKSALMRYYTSAPSTSRWVKERSAAMRVRLDNNVGQIQEDIDLLLDPSWMGNLKRWTNRYGYFAQRFVQGQVDTVAWLAAYQQEMERLGAAETDEVAVKQAIAEADTIVRLTQGSVTPADTAGYERSTAFARLFTQFSSYFNSVLNQIASAPPGSRARATMLGLMLPALGAAVIAAAASGGDEFDDKDGDGYDDEVVKWLFATQGRAAAGLVPGFGPLLAQALSGDRRVADRLQPAPAWSALQALARSVSNVTSGDPRLRGREVSDLFQVFAVATGVPIGGTGRSLGYVLDVNQGRIVPRDNFDYARGVASGRASAGTRL